MIIPKKVCYLWLFNYQSGDETAFRPIQHQRTTARKPAQAWSEGHASNPHIKEMPRDLDMKKLVTKLHLGSHVITSKKCRDEYKSIFRKECSEFSTYFFKKIKFLAKEDWHELDYWALVGNDVNLTTQPLLGGVTLLGRPLPEGSRLTKKPLPEVKKRRKKTPSQGDHVICIN